LKIKGHGGRQRKMAEIKKSQNQTIWSKIKTTISPLQQMKTLQIPMQWAAKMPKKPVWKISRVRSKKLRVKITNLRFCPNLGGMHVPACSRNFTQICMKLATRGNKKPVNRMPCSSTLLSLPGTCEEWCLERMNLKLHPRW